MPDESWMQPALQTSEAVLLPALERTGSPAPRFGMRYLPAPSCSEAFRPVSESWEQPAPAIRRGTPRGSMAGRSVLRAAGVRTTPVCRKRR